MPTRHSIIAYVAAVAAVSSAATGAHVSGKGKGKGKGAGVSNQIESKAKGTSMHNSKALKDLPRSQIGWAGDGKAMLAAQAALAARQQWSPAQRAYLESVKRSLIGPNATMTPSRLNQFDPDAVCKWDCYQRMTMLEPLAAEIFNSNIPGDFVEAGVFTGGTSIFMCHTRFHMEGRVRPARRSALHRRRQPLLTVARALCVF